MAANAAQQAPTPNWPYGSNSGGEGQVHENPEWEKARQALASISKSQNSTKTSPTNRTTQQAGQYQATVTDSSAMQQQQQYYQQWYQQNQQQYAGYPYPYNYYYPMPPYGGSYTPGQYGVPGGYQTPTTPTGQTPAMPMVEDQSSSYPSQPPPLQPLNLPSESYVH